MKTTKWVGLAGIMVGSFMVSGVAFAATYNFYFNNTEQGDNSTATPNVTVQQDDKGGPAKVTKTGGDIGPNPMASAVPAVMEERVTTPIVAPAEPIEQEPRASIDANTRQHFFGSDSPFRHFSMGLGLAVLDRNEPASSGSVSDPFGNTSYSYSSSPGTSTTGGLVLTLGYDFNRDVGLRAFAVAYSDGNSMDYTADSKTDWAEGADLELTPLHIKVGRRENFIDLGAIAGATLYKETSDAVRPFGGPRVNVNFSNAIQATTSYRFSSAYNMLEMGVAFRI